MKTGLLLLAVFTMQCPVSESIDSEVVWLKDATRFVNGKRTLSDPDLPDDITLQINRGSSVLTLNLKRNHGIDPNADVYFVRRLINGRSRLEKAINLETKDVAYYQDRNNGAFMTVRCIRTLNGQCNRVINGNVQIHTRNYDLRPAEIDFAYRNLLDIPDPGTRYILRDQANIQGNIMAENAQQNKIQFGHDVRDSRSFTDGQHSRSYTQPTNSALSSINVPGLRKRDGTESSTYWIEIAVLIDSGLWDFYNTLVPCANNRKKVLQVRNKIQEAYSHIINGVSLLYADIDDPEIEIHVTLRAFYIFEKKSDFTLTHTDVKTVNGKDKIEAYSYLNQLIGWDRGMSRRPGTDHDHAMLFTKYDLYKGSIQNNNISGLSLVGEVCNVGKRTSVIEVNDYFLTVTTAAHELGHNLGAVHDGEEGSTDCPENDYFIMSLTEPSFHPNKPYSSNPWFFSNCSVKAFKKTLKDKICLRNIGRVFDNTKWTQYIKFPPGKVYNANEQCEMINGKGSIFCGAISADICRLMKCSHPKTRECMSKYFSAARGTPCGANKWCIRGYCVAKDSK